MVSALVMLVVPSTVNEPPSVEPAMPPSWMPSLFEPVEAIGEMHVAERAALVDVDRLADAADRRPFDVERADRAGAVSAAGVVVLDADAVGIGVCRC